MATHKMSLTVLSFVSMMIILSLFSGFGEGRKYLKYGVITKDRIPNCRQNPENCVRVPANQYHLPPGCKNSTHCYREKYHI
ncbi:hypothetical protein ARALYDRAFT_893442 [Arabidopsis lyrata subsp. lyrata]|uniref:Uncharacterized protein n=1 Tax=Arabidopsis lyrata subsp. lyrata TaxID=81972 RepID=D7KW75_ARALL|nr:protein RALF-like 35 [Arabidopsis lyrata subsp. lyrata]EFH62836.1 hypothetical protein ARALYDRAFT_893442 [Arabidopsis lyrata subsp. lyrata]|eukprot:XP_020890140.1 protein RALF-like 35 [Arabidopsis lyrata subsp. lyrata]